MVTRWPPNPPESGAVNLFDFGGDPANTNNLTPLVSAIAALGTTGGKIFVNQGTYLFSSLPVITTPINIIGDGRNSTVFQLTVAATTFAAFSTVAGCGLRDITINANSLATNGLSLDAVSFSHFENVRVVNATGVCWLLTATAHTANLGTQWNTFINCSSPTMEASCIGMQLNGDTNTLSAVANCNNNSFVGTSISHTGGIGIDIQNGDNNRFVGTHILRPSGAGVSLNFGPEARSNFFYHVEAKGGVTAGVPDSTVYSNAIFGYDKENAQPEPTISAGASLTWTTTGRSTSGWHVPSQAINPRYNAFYKDDFGSGSQASTTAGELGWSFTNGTFVILAGEANHPGIAQRSTGGIAQTYTYLGAGSGIATFLPADYFDILFILRPNDNSVTTNMRVGLANAPTTTPPTDGIFFEKLITDTNWFRVTRAGGVQTRTDTTFAVPSASWTQLRIRRIDATTIGFTVDANAEQTLTTNITALALLPWIQWGSTAGAITFDFDYFQLAINNLSR